MKACDRCGQVPHIEDHHSVSHRRVGEPGKHIRRHLCGCGCKAVEFYHVINVSAMRSKYPYPDRESLIPAHDFPIYQTEKYGNAEYIR